MVIPPPKSYNRTTQYYLDLSEGTSDPAEIISDINFYKEQLDSLQTEYYQKLAELSSYKQKVERILSEGKIKRGSISKYGEAYRRSMRR